MHGIDGMEWGMSIGWIIVPIVLITLIWLFFKVDSQNKNSSHRIGKSALDILKERYAKGEINNEEFEEKRNIIES